MCCIGKFCYVSIAVGSHSQLVWLTGRWTYASRSEEHVEATDVVVPVSDSDVVHFLFGEVDGNASVAVVGVRDRVVLVDALLAESKVQSICTRWIRF